MSASRRLLIFGGVGLALWGMAYGLFYAVFIEHQTLEAMGGSLASGFIAAAQRNLPQANAGIASYLATRFNYVRQVDVHSHWAGLAILLIVFGALFDRVAFDERKRVYLALAFLVGSVVFPLGVILQTLTRGPVASALAVSGAALVIIALAGIAVGLARSGEQA